VSSPTLKIPNSKSSVTGWSFNEPKPGESTVARYSRVAMVETVLSIRDQQHRTVRRMIVGTLLLAGVAVIAAGIMGWL
jgi:hypothetical protein